MKIIEEIAAQAETARAWRRDIHAHPAHGPRTGHSPYLK